jgi:hypothetical protein
MRSLIIIVISSLLLSAGFYWANLIYLSGIWLGAAIVVLLEILAFVIGDRNSKTGHDKFA